MAGMNRWDTLLVFCPIKYLLISLITILQGMVRKLITTPIRCCRTREPYRHRVMRKKNGVVRLIVIKRLHEGTEGILKTDFKTSWREMESKGRFEYVKAYWYILSRNSILLSLFLSQIPFLIFFFFHAWQGKNMLVSWITEQEGDSVINSRIVHESFYFFSYPWEHQAMAHFMFSSLWWIVCRNDFENRDSAIENAKPTESKMLALQTKEQNGERQGINRQLLRLYNTGLRLG